MTFFIFIGRIFSLPAILVKNFFNQKDGPTRLRLILEELGGVYIKLGQILAMRFDILPMKYAMGILDILDNVRPVENEKMFEVFEREFDRKIGEVFEHVEKEPLGTASFGQVYKAKLNGEEVAVKIQKPESEKYIKADLLFLKFVFFIGGLFGILKSVPPKEILAQLKEWLSDELDYAMEARNNQILYEHAKEHNLQNILIPKVYLELATKKVLVQEFLSGSQAKRIMVYRETRPEALEKFLDEKNIDLLLAANAFIYDLTRQYFIDGFFHADPHPANLMIFPGNKIGYVDFGIIGRSLYDNTGMLRFVKGATELDFRGSAEGIVEYLNERLTADYGEMIESEEKIKQIYETTLEFITSRLTEDMAPILKDWHFLTGRKDATLSERSSARVFLKIAKAIEKYRLKFPPDVVAFLRTLVIIDMVALKLAPNFNMVEALRAFFEKNTVESIHAIKAEHRQEMTRLETLESLHIIEEAPEKRGEASVKAQEKNYAAKERLMDLFTTLAEKYQELYNEIKDIN